MAEVNVESNKKGKGKRRKTSVSTSVDMTPMVDLAFLLITFFMLTTTFSKPQAMDINMPAKAESNQKPELKGSKTLMVVLGENNKVFYYMGTESPDVKVTDFSDKGIRNVIVKKRAEIKDVVIIVKATARSKYKNMVDVLDEINLSGEGARYSMGKITPKDEELIAGI